VRARAHVRRRGGGDRPTDREGAGGEAKGQPGWRAGWRAGKGNKVSYTQVGKFGSRYMKEVLSKEFNKCLMNLYKVGLAFSP
jgi:hypothetical protein